MGFRVDTSAEAERKDFDRVSKVPGGTLAYLSRFPEAIVWIAEPSVLEQMVALGLASMSGYDRPIRLRLSVLNLLWAVDDDIAAHLVSTTGDEIPNLSRYSEKVQRKAVERNPHRIKSLFAPSEKVLMICAHHRWGSLDLMAGFSLSDKVIMRAIQSEGSQIQYVKNPTMAMMEKAVRKNGDNLQHIKNPPPAIVRLAIQKSGMAIRHVKDPSEELQRLAVSRCAQAITVIDNPIPELQQAAVAKSPNVIRLIKNPDEDAMWAALQQKPKLIKDLKQATPEMESFVAIVT